jgi:predicted GNAT family acetyltransferase
MTAFAVEALDQREHGRTERMLDLRLHHAPDPGLYLWEDPLGTPVCLVATGGRTPNGIRIGPVYTPPGRRGRGYASALTAAVSTVRLGSGARVCFLYTDLANPTSNRIYQNVGYEPVCDAAEFRFEGG